MLHRTHCYEDANGDLSRSPNNVTSRHGSNTLRRASSEPTFTATLPSFDETNSLAVSLDGTDKGDADTRRLPKCDGQNGNIKIIIKALNELKADLEMMIRLCPVLGSQVVRGTEKVPVLVFHCLEAQLVKAESQLWVYKLRNEQVGVQHKFNAVIETVKQAGRVIDKYQAARKPLYRRWEEELEEWSAAKKEADARLAAQQAEALAETEAEQASGSGGSAGGGSGSVDDDGRGSELNWVPQPPEQGPAKHAWDEGLYADIPVGIREFMKTEKRLKEQHRQQGTLGG
ncbi:hypothetical protein BN1723_012473 [Verticillium longisporum]|uniref:Uncharacterized protein n=1 Tax=Verticillium longisporum TaxID=100787 RepID=A0A0G4LIH5_VERLO|nr:hypothetical protein BN1723_012473 [Verticillium longisporum]